MTKRFYFFAFLFLGLSILITLFHSIIYLQLNAEFLGMDSFGNWYSWLLLDSLISILITITYYRSKGYSFAFWAGMISGVAALGQLIVIYQPLAMQIAIIAGTAYGVSLLFSEAAKRPWLKVAGAFMLMVNISLTLVWIIRPMAASAESIHPWTIFAYGLLPLPFCFNFISEYKSLRQIRPQPSQRQLKFLEGVMLGGYILAIALTLYVGPTMARESYNIIQWNRGTPEREKAVAEPFDARTYINSQGDTLRYRLLKPENYNAAQRYPLAVCLHHGGSHGKDNIRQVEGSGVAQLLYENRTKFKAFVFVPQCSPGTSWSGVNGSLPDTLLIDTIVFETIKALETEFMIDTTRRYVIGLSMGGFGAWYFISTRPDMFAAAIPIAGGGDPKYAPVISKIPVWAFHGENDKQIPVSRSREMIDAMKNAGGNPRYTEYPGAGHHIWESVKATPDLLTWLFAQKRE